jgi:uncharacterized protein YyaL (SSP411 family)
MPQTENRLARETSPYLLQHAHNPVDWYPWGEEALARARAEDKPILLSIGYSACHWCHVMAHESFEDPTTAQLMNEWFINIKVDREERPDLDKIYQLAHQLLAQRPGGWPLTVFLTPQQIPYFAGTYFPKTPRYNMPGFGDVLRQIATAYREQGEAIAEQSQALLAAMQQTLPQADDQAVLSPAPLDSGRRELENQYDNQYGGFGKAPKFPHPSSLERLLRHWHHTREVGHEDGRALEMVRVSLHAMASGGLFDQLGGGFCRYSTDDLWMTPHFEKMLYDNGQLLGLYTQAWQATGDAAFARVARETAGWVMREMQSPEGGYYSAQDADTEGEEGRFYVWTPEEIQSALEDDEYRVASLHYGLDREPNFEGRWYPHVHVGLDEVAESLEMTPQQARDLLDSGRAKLFSAREQRTRPGTDTKVLTAWNALMIKGMALAGAVLEEPDYLASAQRAVDFIRQQLWRDGRLLAVYKDGQAKQPAYLDDHAYLLDALLGLLQANWRGEDLAFALELAEVLLQRFEADEGGFFYTAHDHESLIHRPKPTMDESIPSGNGIAATALQRLGHLVGEHRYNEAAERTLKACWPPISQLPYAHNALLTALEEYLYPGQTVVLRGHGEALREWRRLASSGYWPRRFVYAIDSVESGLPGPLAERHTTGPACAWVCEGSRCLPPADTLENLRSQLASTRG